MLGSRQLFLLVFAWLLLAANGQSAVIERDWLAPGDGLLTYDTVNQREWLDVGVSLLDQFDPVDFNPAVEKALLELLPGGRFEDFTLAKRVDFLDLAASAGIRLDPERVPEDNVKFGVEEDGTFGVEDYAPANALQQLLGRTSNHQPGATFGVLDELTGVDAGNLIPGLSVRYVTFFRAFILRRGAERVDLGFRVSGDFHTPDRVGLMLYRVAIPEPSSATLLVLWFVTFAARYRGCFEPSRVGARHSICHAKARG